MRSDLSDLLISSFYALNFGFLYSLLIFHICSTFPYFSVNKELPILSFFNLHFVQLPLFPTAL